MRAALALSLPRSRAACFELGRLAGRLQLLAARGGGRGRAGEEAELLAEVGALGFGPGGGLKGWVARRVTAHRAPCLACCTFRVGMAVA